MSFELSKKRRSSGLRGVGSEFVGDRQFAKIILAETGGVGCDGGHGSA